MVRRGNGSGHAWPAMVIAMLASACGGNTIEPAGGETSPDEGGTSPVQGSIARTCGRFAGCGEVSRTECERELADSHRLASDSGCAAEFMALLSCDEQNPGPCASGGGYDLDVACEAARERVVDCVGITGGGGGECSVGGGGCASPPCQNSCFIQCSDFAAECRGPPGEGMSCSCTAGSHAGGTFYVADCGAMEATAYAVCR